MCEERKREALRDDCRGVSSVVAYKVFVFCPMQEKVSYTVMDVANGPQKLCLICLVVVALALSLLEYSPLQGSEPVVSANQGVEVRGNKIYRNGEIFLELRYLYPSPPSGDKYYGIAAYYYPSKQEVWIYPKGGWQVRGGPKSHYTVKEIEEAMANPYTTVLREGKVLSKEEAIAGWCFDIKISEDGRFVIYKTYSPFRMYLGEWLSRRSGQYVADYTQGRK